MPRPYPKPLRLRGYDYTSTGSYFVTICTHRRAMCFEDDTLRILTEDVWQTLPERFPSVQLDAFIVMPNHVHGITCLTEAGDVAVQKPTLSAVIGAFKSHVSVHWLAWLRDNDPGRSGRIWQRGYYERIMRNERQLNAVRQYIRDNPRRWAEDRDNLDRLIERMDPRV